MMRHETSGPIEIAAECSIIHLQRNFDDGTTSEKNKYFFWIFRKFLRQSYVVIEIPHFSYGLFN
jgi:hypothetical protein